MSKQWEYVAASTRFIHAITGSLDVQKQWHTIGLVKVRLVEREMNRCLFVYLDE
jgi:hypothetical protein